LNKPGFSIGINGVFQPDQVVKFGAYPDWAVEPRFESADHEFVLGDEFDD
jgi:hypothetical protein